jgi:glycosyltransferase involved in cell wall biosynthesis
LGGIFSVAEKVLVYVHHVGSNGGATNSLVEMISGTTTSARRVLIAPRGSAAPQFDTLFDQVIYVPGIPQFDNTRFGYYKGIRWLILLREIWLFFLTAPIFLLFLLRYSRNISAIHYNEITLTPLALISKCFVRRHVFHVRSLQAVNWRQSLIFRIFSKSIFLPIDEWVQATIPYAVEKQLCRNTFTFHNKTIQQSFRNRSNKTRLELVMLGGEPYQKGIDIALEAVSQLREELGIDLQIQIFGLSNIHNWKSKIRRCISPEYNRCINSVLSHRLSSWVKFEGFTSDREYIFGTKNMLLFTTRLNAPGRPIIESCHFRVPSIFCSDNDNPGVYKDVSICCACDVDNVKVAIEEMLEKIAIGISSDSFESVVALHSTHYQVRTLSQSYGVHICQKF